MQCGADVVWNPGAAALKCPFCGAERTVPTTHGEIREHPIEEALRAPRDLGWSLSEAIEPFPTHELVPYEPSYLSGFLAEEYAVDVQDALRIARDRMAAEIRAAGSAAIPGDTQQNLQVATAWSSVAYKNALLPLWIAAYDYAGTPYRFLVNGVTGKVSGKAPWSWVKIGLAVLALLGVLLIGMRSAR